MLHKLLTAILGFVVFASAGLGQEVQSRKTPWTNSMVQGSPEPPHPYLFQRAFSNFTFKSPVELIHEPGTKDLFLLEQGGKIYRFNETNATVTNLVADLRPLHRRFDSAYSLAFDPGYLTNRYLWVNYVARGGDPEGSKVARFVMKQDGTLDLSSELIVLTWLSGGHNGCSLRFGPDGMLYISTGDATDPEPPDRLNTGQDNTDFLAAILRIDVRNSTREKPYVVPPDNPFITYKDHKPEIWAYGFRNAWRMSFDRVTGNLWVGDVGWEMWELIYDVKKGGNYGWSIAEGPQSIKPQGKRGPTPISSPVVSHSHSEAASITGGYVYRGKKYPELLGRYVYGDYETGKMWAFAYEDGKAKDLREIADSNLRIVSFGENVEGELYIVDHSSGNIFELVPNPERNRTQNFPRLLSKTGIFSNVKELSPSPGVVPYEPTVPQWMDGAVARRFIALPGSSQLTNPAGPWAYPKDSVLVRSIDVEGRRLETQLLHYDGQNWNGYTYKWNSQQDDAELVPAEGKEVALEVTNTDGVKQPLNWRLHSRSECMRCHNNWAGYVLGFTPLQLSDAQFQRISDEKLFRDLPKPRKTRLAATKEKETSIQARAMSYLHANCAHCHRFGGGGSASMILDFETPLDKAKMLNLPPMQGNFGLTDSAIIKAGLPESSVLLLRMSKLGSGRMPHIGSRIVDIEARHLIHDWIASLDPQAAKPSSGLGSPNEAMAALREIEDRKLSKEALVEKALASTNTTIRDLFIRFRPERAAQQLGQAIDPAKILSLKGNLERGRTLVQNGNGQCLSCHQIENAGINFGPSLSKIGAKYSPEQLIHHIVNPSALIEPDYTAYTFEIGEDVSGTGFVRGKGEQEVTVLTQSGETKVPVSKLQKTGLSLMPEGLLQGFTAQEAADLISYLSSLKN